VKRELKHAGLRVLRSSGVFSAAARMRRRDTLLILCYHGISLRDEHEWEGGLYLTPQQFQDRLLWLRESCANVLPLGVALDLLEKRSLPPRSVALTFDDGFYDFYRHAVPLLSEFGFPCTVYLTTFYCDYRLPIFNLVINYILWKSASRAGALQEARLTEVRRYVDHARAQKLDTEARDTLARQCAESHGVDYDSILRDRLFQLMSPEEVSMVAKKGIDVQLHTHRHRTPLDRELFVREIRDNSRRIEEFTGRTPRHFCYPSGVTAPDFLPWLRDCGVRSATTCEPGLISQRSERLMLPRYLDGGGMERIDFEGWLSGIL